MPKIQNIAWYDLIHGYHIPSEDAVLIQITDPDTAPPEPLNQFYRRHTIRFLDLDQETDTNRSVVCSHAQATDLVRMLQQALKEDRDVVVHCTAGVCRSGAVAEVGTMMGFEDTGSFRIPNVLVKTRMMRALGWTYENS